MSEKSEKEAQKNDGIWQLINSGVEIVSSGAGSGTGAVLGSVVGGPVGALIGGAGGKVLEIVLSKVGQEISARQLGPREKVRVGAAFAIAAADIRQRIENGESVRTDDFFDEKQTGRSDAEEVAESVLLKVQREPEEKKIRYMGYLLSSIAFNPQISVHMAHQLAKAAEQLTYRQLCILKLCVVKDNFGLRDNNYREQETFKKDLHQVLYECADLHNREYIHSGGNTVTSQANVLSRVMSVKPSGMTLQGIGEDLFKLMKLSLIPDQDIIPIAMQLK